MGIKIGDAIKDERRLRAELVSKGVMYGRGNDFC